MPRNSQTILSPVEEANQEQWAWGSGSLTYFHFPGLGTPILFLHGVTRRWQTFMAIPNVLRGERETFALDFPGHGGSTTRMFTYFVQDYAIAVGAFMESVIRRPVILYGHSLGAMVAALVGSRIPRLTMAMILEDPPFHTMGNRLEGSYHHRYFASLQDLVRRRSEESLMFKQLSAMTVTEPGSGAEVPLKTIRDPASIRFTAGCLMALDPAVLDPIVAGNWLDGYDVRETLAGIPCPTLLLQADPQRGGMLSEEDAQLAESLISDCARVRIPGCGHLIHGLQPEESTRYTLPFLASLPRQGSNPC